MKACEDPRLIAVAQMAAKLDTLSVSFVQLVSVCRDMNSISKGMLDDMEKLAARVQKLEEHVYWLENEEDTKA